MWKVLRRGDLGAELDKDVETLKQIYIEKCWGKERDMQMDPMNKVVELEKRIMNLEKKLERKQTEAISPIRLFGEAIASLLFGIFIIGPLITGVCALVVLLMSYMNV